MTRFLKPNYGLRVALFLGSVCGPIREPANWPRTDNLEPCLSDCNQSVCGFAGSPSRNRKLEPFWPVRGWVATL